jgi:peptidoglycan lytic transglycosylase
MKTAVVLLLLLVFLVGCSHKPVSVAVPEAPPPAQAQQLPESANAGPQVNTEQPEFPLDAKALWAETGIASWYGAPYHNRRASNGEVYDMHAMTAAHRTLPLGTIVRVTDIKTGSSALVRITDRGPFIEGRIIDLSQSAAQKIGIVQRGTAEVRIDVLKTPSPITTGGRWAVQIGAFEREKAARELAARLSRRYRTASVLTFNSPVGDWWVRIRVKNDLRARAEEVLHDTTTSEGAIFLVRLD